MSVEDSLYNIRGIKEYRKAIQALAAITDEIVYKGDSIELKNIRVPLDQRWQLSEGMDANVLYTDPACDIFAIRCDRGSFAPKHHHIQRETFVVISGQLELHIWDTENMMRKRVLTSSKDYNSVSVASMQPHEIIATEFCVFISIVNPPIVQPMSVPELA